MATRADKMSLKLLINSQTNRVVYAETGKDCVDFLIQLLSLPLATVMSLTQEEQTLGRLSNIFESFKKLNDSYLQPGQTKDAIFYRIGAAKTPAPLSTPSVSTLFATVAPAPTRPMVYKCTCSGNSYSDTKNAICTTCHRQISQQLRYVAPLGSEEKESCDVGFVKGGAYMVMDDLVIEPLSTGACLNLLAKSGINDIISGLKEIQVQIGFKEAVKLLKTSFHSKTVLTDVFLKNGAVQVKTE